MCVDMASSSEVCSEYGGHVGGRILWERGVALECDLGVLEN